MNQTTEMYAICTGRKERVYAIIEAPTVKVATKWALQDYPELRQVFTVTVRIATKNDADQL